MSKDLQEDLQNLDLNYLDEISLPSMDLKKSVSQPPPGFYFHEMIKILPNKEEMTQKKEETKEYNDYIKKMKKFNPRLAEEGGFRKTLKNNSTKKADIAVKPNENMYYKPFPKMNEEYEAVVEDQKQGFDMLNQKEAFNFIVPTYLENSYFHYGYQYDYNYMRQPKNDEERKSLKLKSLTESKKMQADYEKGSVEKREEIFIIAYHKLFEMIYDTYNNYIIQKIFELGELSHKKLLFEKLKLEQFLNIATHKFGCRVIQKTVEAFTEQNSSEYQYLRNVIFHNLNSLVIHENGSLVIQKCLEKFKSEDFLFILGYINSNFRYLAYDKNGCLIIQKLFDIYPIKEDAILKSKINETILYIISHSFELSKKSYSNYIIQHLLETGQSEHKEKLLNHYVKPNFISLSCDQFASNVAEKSIINSDKEFRKNVWHQLMKNNEEVFLKLVNDKYGNYVMQRIYEYADGEVQDEYEKLLLKLKLQLNPQGNFVLKFVQNNNNREGNQN